MHGNELVHDTTFNTHKIMLCRLTYQSQLHAVEGAVEKVVERHAETTF